MIFINGGTKNQQMYASSLVVFICQKFNIQPTVEVNFRRMTNDHCSGSCIKIDNSEYEVDLKRSLKMRELLVTLAHEMVHVKQYELNEIKDDNKDCDYWDLPHEIEAHGRETGLFIRWAEKENLSKKSWAQEK